MLKLPLSHGLHDMSEGCPFSAEVWSSGFRLSLTCNNVLVSKTGICPERQEMPPWDGEWKKYLFWFFNFAKRDNIFKN